MSACREEAAASAAVSGAMAGSMQSVCEGKEFDFPAEELKTLSFWDATVAFKCAAVPWTQEAFGPQY